MARMRVKFSLSYISPKTWLLWQEEMMVMQDARREKVARASLPQLPYESTASAWDTNPSQLRALGVIGSVLSHLCLKCCCPH